MGRSRMPIQILGGQRQAAVAAAAVGLAVVTFHTALFLGDDDDGRSDFGPLCPGPPLLSPASASYHNFSLHYSALQCFRSGVYLQVLLRCFTKPNLKFTSLP